MPEIIAVQQQQIEELKALVMQLLPEPLDEDSE